MPHPVADSPPIPPGFSIAIFVIAGAVGVAIAYFGISGALGGPIP